MSECGNNSQLIIEIDSNTVRNEIKNLSDSLKNWLIILYECYWTDLL